MDSKIKLLLKFAFSLALFIAIFYIIGFDKIATVLANMDITLFFLAVFVYILVNVGMSFRISVVLKSIGEHFGLLDVFPSNMAGMLASDFTPARAGYFFTAFSLSSKFGITLEKSILSIFGPQLLDFTIKISSAAILTLILMNQFGVNDILLNVIILLLALSAVLFAGLLVFYPPLLDRLVFLQKIPLASKVFSFLSRLHEHSHKLLSIKSKILVITMFTWFLKSLEWLLLAKAFNISITGDFILDLGFMMVFQGSMTILQFLPLPTLAGAGASEAGFIAVLYFFGVPLEVGLAFGFMTRFVMILVDVFSLPVLYDFVHRYGVDNLLARISNKGL